MTQTDMEVKNLSTKKLKHCKHSLKRPR